MKPPRPILRDPSVLPSVRADLEVFSRALPAFDVELSAASFAQRLEALGSAPGNDVIADKTGAGSGAASGAKGATLYLVKATLAIVGCAVLGVATFQALDPASGESIQQRAAPAALPAPVAIPPGAPESRPVTTEPEADARAPSPSLQPGLQRAARTQASVQARDSASRREIAQLMRVRELLELDPAAAYRLAQSSQREFPTGALREEREGLSIVALFELGQSSSARAEAARFLARHPESPLRDRIERLSQE
jgi:hypothetical protein